MHGQGSGFIVSADGYILTNAHVVDDASEVNVKLTDRREFKAKVVGADQQSDVALLKIDAKDLPTVRLGNSAGTNVGEWVVAIGAPVRLREHGDRGHRERQVALAARRRLRAVHPDRRGGEPRQLRRPALQPGRRGDRHQLADLQPARAASRACRSRCPIEVALKVKDELAEYGKVTRGRLGVTVQDVNAALADSFGLDRPRGALVAEVEKGSPAERAGLESGDVIVGLNGKAIERSSDLPHARRPRRLPATSAEAGGVAQGRLAQRSPSRSASARTRRWPRNDGHGATAPASSASRSGR